MEKGLALVTTTFTTTAGEVVAVSRSILYRGWSYWALLALVVGVPIGAAVWCECDSAHIALLVGVAGAGIVFWYLSPWIYVSSTRRGASNPNGPFTFTCGDAGVRVDAPHAKVEWNWTALHHVVETRDYVLLYIARHQAQFIPKRALDADGLAALRGLLSASVAKRS